MQTRVQKWGNSLALRIPKSFAADVGLDDNSVVELTVRDGMLVVVPAPRQPYTLDQLLAAVTDDNLHGEIDTGAPVGQEGW
jgi:antitoxin MazE